MEAVGEPTFEEAQAAIMARIFPVPGDFERSLPERIWTPTDKKNEQGEPLWSSKER